MSLTQIILRGIILGVLHFKISCCNTQLGQCSMSMRCGDSETDVMSRTIKRFEGIKGDLGDTGANGLQGPKGDSGENCECADMPFLLEELNRLRRRFPSDCSQVHWVKNGFKVVQIYPFGEDPAGVRIRCDMRTEPKGWTIIQRRFNGKEDFYRGWWEYVEGFGQPDEEYWIGLEVMHHLTKNNDKMLRIDIEDRQGNKAYAEYSTFIVGPAMENYMLTIGGYNGMFY